MRSTSSIRYKKDVKDLTAAQADEILKLRPITYQSKAPSDDPDVRWWGFIAEEVAEIEPRLVQWGYKDEDYRLVDGPDNTKTRTLKKDAELVADGVQADGVQYERLTVGLVALAQRQQEEIATLKEEIKAMKLAK
jgi:hypothetical protein